MFCSEGDATSNKLLAKGYVKEHLKSSMRKLNGRYGDLIKQYEVPLSRMLNDILKPNHILFSTCRTNPFPELVVIFRTIHFERPSVLSRICFEI